MESSSQTDLVALSRKIAAGDYRSAKRAVEIIEAMAMDPEVQKAAQEKRKLSEEEARLAKQKTILEAQAKEEARKAWRTAMDGISDLKAFFEMAKENPVLVHGIGHQESRDLWNKLHNQFVDSLRALFDAKEKKVCDSCRGDGGSYSKRGDMQEWQRCYSCDGKKVK